MKKHIDDLTKKEIIHLVAKANGWNPPANDAPLYGSCDWVYSDGNRDVCVRNYDPLANWQQCGELIEKFKGYAITNIGTGGNNHTAV